MLQRRALLPKEQTVTLPKGVELVTVATTLGVPWVLRQLVPKAALARMVEETAQAGPIVTGRVP